ncbi:MULTISPECIES: hypothetical protein [Deinococcus]|uniref:Uncharacterized protein n=1 Tax=Deinococcus multiflagellatus TaxID=1656887 RepID=A0ABW1ZFR3_9DEIO|nr:MULTISPECIES: hypothetical protein [Deinococcus]MBZ9711884.1 hypothetical protein [Deinococcus multiflagellatus]
MKISRFMPLEPILARMGAQTTTDREALIMRDLLSDAHDGHALDDLPEEEWLRLMGLMEQRKLQADPGMR